MIHRFKIQIIITLSLLTACDRQSDPTADYTSRLSSVLNVDVSKDLQLNESVYPAFPALKELTLIESEHSISIREFLGLRECRLHLVIAERNSQMGKVAPSSQRLKNDLDILATGPACLATLENQTLKSTLQRYLEIKKTDLPKRLWHALLAQAEYRQFWLQKSYTPSYPDQLPSSTVNSDLLTIETFAAKILNGQYQVSDTEFNQLEQSLGRLRYGDGGQLLTELHNLHKSLTTANSAIDYRLKHKLCIRQQPTNAARNLQNVVNKFFIANVQAKAVKLVKRHAQLRITIERLEASLHPHSNEAYQEWVKSRNLTFDRGLTAALKHAQKLQRLYTQCGLSAGNSR